MFYRTQIKSVTDYGAVDMAGKKLRFMGYLPVKAGDWVFTDGTYIFGNVPPRGSPATFGEDPAGIPVLDSGNLRGYFSRNGIYKNYPVKQDAWLVNSDKKFAHGSEDNVIDAELADDGSLLTVEKNPVQVQDNDEDFTVLFYHYCYNNRAVRSVWEAYWVEYYSMQFLGTNIRGSEISVTASHFWKMTEENGFPPFDYFKNDELIKDCELIIKKDGQEFETLKLSELVEPAEKTAWEYIDIEIPCSMKERHIKSGAILRNFKIAPDGKWEALIEIEIGAEYFYSSNTVDFRTIQILSHYSYAPFSSIAVHFLFLFKVDSEGNSKRIAEYSEFMPLWHRINLREYGKSSEYHETVADTFPYISWAATNRVYSINPDTGRTVFVEAEWYSVTIYDSRLMFNAPDYDNPKIEHDSNFYFPVQDDFQAKFTNAQDDIDKWTLDGIFDSDSKEIIGAFLPTNETDAHTWNTACASLKGGSFLFGIHNKALYKFDGDANFSLVGDNLKNFRLRELKNISKSRR